MKSIYLVITAFAFCIGCSAKEPQKEKKRIQKYNRGSEINIGIRDSVYSQLVAASGNLIDPLEKKDSLTLMVLPLEASCPACLEKTIDSLLAHQHQLTDDHYIIISIKGSVKTIRGYFIRQNGNIPTSSSIILDTLNLTSRFNLHDNNPTFYFIKKQQAITKKPGIPESIKSDLHHFFTTRKI